MLHVILLSDIPVSRDWYKTVSKGLSLCNKSQFSNTYIYIYISTTKLCKTLILWYNRSPSLKYLKSTTLRYKDLKIGVCGKDSIPLRKKKKSEKTRIIRIYKIQNC